MTKKITPNHQTFNAVDLIWDGWVNSFKTIQEFQTEMDETSLQTVENQKELLNTVRGKLRKIEEDTKIMEEWKTTLPNSLNTNENTPTWMRQFEEINNLVQGLSWTPGNVMLDLSTRSLTQFETNVKEVIFQQQKGRSDVMKTVEQLTEKIKQTHRDLLPSA